MTRKRFRVKSVKIFRKIYVHDTMRDQWLGLTRTQASQLMKDLMRELLKAAKREQRKEKRG